MAALPVIGVDVGGVLMDRAHLGVRLHTMDMDAYRAIPEVPGAIAGIAMLVQAFRGRVWLISRASKALVVDGTLVWLAHHRFHERTGVDVSQVVFCAERAGKEALCRRIGATHMIDDRLDVLQYLSFVPHRILFRPRPAEIAQLAHILPDVTRVESWEELLLHLSRP
jgi:hypothetical protein